MRGVGSCGNRSAAGTVASILVLLLGTELAYAACNVLNGEAFGDCANVTVNSGPHPFIEVDGDRSISGMISGALVHENGSLHLAGMSSGDVTVKPGGSLDVTGMVSARVINDGGDIQISGTVTSLLVNGGTTRISGVVHSVLGLGVVVCELGAVVNGRPHLIQGADC